MLALLLVRSWSSKARPFAVSLTTERCNALPSYVKTAESGDNRREAFAGHVGHMSMPARSAELHVARRHHHPAWGFLAATIDLAALCIGAGRKAR